MRTIIECVPNVSEGRDAETVEAVAEAVRSSPGVQLLDVSSGVSHRRGVLTFVGEAAALRAGVAKAIRYFKRRFRYLEGSVWNPPRWGTALWPIVAIALVSLSYHRGRSQHRGLENRASGCWRDDPAHPGEPSLGLPLSRDFWRSGP